MASYKNTSWNGCDLPEVIEVRIKVGCPVGDVQRQLAMGVWPVGIILV